MSCLTSLRIFVSMLFFLQGGLMITFLTSNALIFFIFFESTLIPMLFILGIFGPNRRKVKALNYLVFYTAASSLFLMLAIIFLYLEFNTFSFFSFEALDIFLINSCVKKKLWWCFYLCFAVKIPIVPFHIWLPEAHVEAPTVGSVILASLLLKVGLYGFIRFSLFSNLICYKYLPFIFTICTIGIIFGSLIGLVQTDLKKIIAYSSVVHMNLSVIAIFINNTEAFIGSVFSMISHGLISGGLFFF